MRARLHVTNVLVDDQAKALTFYTEKLGFVPKTDVPVGSHRWLTVVAADAEEAWNCCWNLTSIPQPRHSRRHS